MNEEGVLGVLDTLQEEHYKRMLREEYPPAAMALKGLFVSEEELRLVAYNMGIQDMILAGIHAKGRNKGLDDLCNILVSLMSARGGAVVAFEAGLRANIDHDDLYRLSVSLMSALRGEDVGTLIQRLNSINRRIYNLQKQLFDSEH